MGRRENTLLNDDCRSTIEILINYVYEELKRGKKEEALKTCRKLIVNKLTSSQLKECSSWYDQYFLLQR